MPEAGQVASLPVLTRWELRRTWPSLPVTALVMGAFGVLMWAVAGEPLTATNDRVAADTYLLAVCAVLATNFGSRDCWIGLSDAFPPRLAFLRGLPISALQIAAGRALSRLVPTLVNISVLFAVPYLLSVTTGGVLAARLGPLAYLWFALIWVGYGLLWGGLQMYGELGLHGRTYNLLVLPCIPLFVVVALVSNLTFGFGIVDWTMRAASTYGITATAVSLLAGLAAATGLVLVTARRVARRDLVG